MQCDTANVRLLHLLNETGGGHRASETLPKRTEKKIKSKIKVFFLATLPHKKKINKKSFIGKRRHYVISYLTTEGVIRTAPFN